MVKTLDYKVAAIFILIGSILFGFSYIISVIGFENGLTPFELITGRMFIASAVLNLVFFKKIDLGNKPELIAGAVIGLFMFGILAFQVMGLQHTTPSISAFVSSTYVVIIPFIHWAYYKQAPDRYSNIGAILTIVGVGFISLNEELYISIGIILTLICAIFGAFQIFATEVYSKKFDPVNLTIIMLNTCFLIGFVAMMGVRVYSGQPSLIFAPVNMGILLVSGVMATIIPFLLQNIGQKYISATKASLMMSTEAIFGTLFSIIIFNETLNMKMIIGCLLIIFAIVIAETKLKFN